MYHHFKQTIFSAFLLVALLFLTGCDKQTTLHSRLAEAQANLVMAALTEAGVEAHKIEGEEQTWNVMILEKDFAKAVRVLQSEGLPQRPHLGISEVFKKTGIVSSPSEERIRFMDALAQDLSKTICCIEGVLDARVHVVLPENDPFAKNSLPSSAAVAVRTRWNTDLDDKIGAIKGLVKNAIEGLQYEKISVTIFKDQPPKDFTR